MVIFWKDKFDFNVVYLLVFQTTIPDKASIIRFKQELYVTRILLLLKGFQLDYI